MNWQVPRMWEDGDVWILGGGPSLTCQFDIPEHVVQKVMRGESSPSEYSPYMEAIHQKHVIGINVAYLIGDWIDMMFFGDNKFFQIHKERLAAWPGLKVTCHTIGQKYPWVKYLAQDKSHIRGISPNPKMVSWNANSGSAAISVAANAGASRIILVGFDMSLNNSGNQHWHTLYRNMPTAAPPKGKQRDGGRKPQATFTRHLLGFPEIAADAKRRGIEIINVC